MPLEIGEATRWRLFGFGWYFCKQNK